MHRAFLRALCLALPLVTACGGKVIHESGTDGAGGATSSNASTSGPSSGSSSSASTTDSVVATATATSSNATATGQTSTVTSTGSGGLCDNQGFCGDNSSGCIGCALAGPCAAALNDCGASSACIDYADCISTCDPADAACNQKCTDAIPQGAVIYFDLVDCVICQECSNDCAGMGGFPCPGGS